MSGRLLVLAFTVTALSVASSAPAEIVFLANGRTLSVKSHREAGEQIVLSLRGGGEVTCDRSMVSGIGPDEVPYPEPDSADGVATIPADALLATPYAAMIDELSAENGVDPLLVRALIQVESAYHAGARSRKGAMGLMQLMPGTARLYSVRNPYEPRANLDAGIRHLRDLLNRFELSLAVAAYNAGEAAVRRFGGIPPYPETRQYVRDVLSLARPRR